MSFICIREIRVCSVRLFFVEPSARCFASVDAVVNVVQC
jgi:hypothetical protein